MRLQVCFLASLSGLRICCCQVLWCRSQMQLGSCIAVTVAQAGSYSSYSTPSPGTSICHRCGQKKKQKKKKILGLSGMQNIIEKLIFSIDLGGWRPYINLEAICLLVYVIGFAFSNRFVFLNWFIRILYILRRLTFCHINQFTQNKLGARLCTNCTFFSVCWLSFDLDLYFSN